MAYHAKMDLSSELKVKERRRGARVLLRISIKISGTSKDGKRVNENGFVAVVNRNGALIKSPTPLKPSSTVEVLNNVSNEKLIFRVVWVSERAAEGQYESGLELTEPLEEFWGVRFPPPESGAS
jgi:hypothetical protein